jgi:PadR family transcriptional regulator AphA
MVTHPLTIEHALLGFLNQRPMHGYEIGQHLADSAGLGAVWRLKQSQLYALLSKLEEKGFIFATIEPQEARPPRKVYQLTERGRMIFLNWVQSPVSHGRQMRLDFLAKLYFARGVGLPAAKALVDQQRETCRGWLSDLQIRAGRQRVKRGFSYEWLVSQYRVGQVQATIEWLDKCWAELIDASATDDSAIPNSADRK